MGFVLNLCSSWCAAGPRERQMCGTTRVHALLLHKFIYILKENKLETEEPEVQQENSLCIAQCGACGEELMGLSSWARTEPGKMTDEQFCVLFYSLLFS